jgi:hypothetical protein
MSHNNRNFVIAYILLVGVPLLALAGVLRSGRTLTAPSSVDGAWKIEATANRPSSSPCADFLSSVAKAPVSISQSGKSLVIGVNGGNLNGGKTATGTLDGKALKAQFIGAENPTAQDCSDRGLTLTATLDPKVEPRTLSGTLSVDGCGACAPLEFRATRQVRAAAGGAH